MVILIIQLFVFFFIPYMLQLTKSSYTQIYSARDLNEHMTAIISILGNSSEAWEKRVKSVSALLITTYQYYEKLLSTNIYSTLLHLIPDFLYALDLGCYW